MKQATVDTSPASAGIRSIVLFALVTALLCGALLWIARPVPPAGKIVPVLIQIAPDAPNNAPDSGAVTGDGSGPTDLPGLRILESVSGVFDVRLYGGSGSADGVESETPGVLVHWSYSGNLKDLSLPQILKHGEWSATSASVRLPVASRLAPGHYVLEISGRGRDQNAYAGAQSFTVSEPASRTGTPPSDLANTLLHGSSGASAIQARAGHETMHAPTGLPSRSTP